MNEPSTSQTVDPSDSGDSVTIDKQEVNQVKPKKSPSLEDDNEDIAYFYVNLWKPNFLFSLFSLAFLIAAIATSLKTDYIPNAKQLLGGYIVKYGASRFACNTSIAFPQPSLPSLLNLFELNVFGNVLFRMAVCLPMAVRIFTAVVTRYVVEAEMDQRQFVISLAVNCVPLVLIVEIASLSLMAIITVHSDFPEVNRLCKLIFGGSSMLYMILATALFFGYQTSSSHLDILSGILKILAAVAYTILMPNVIYSYHAQLAYPICHSYVPRHIAFMEYGMFAAYAVFHLTSLLDIRDITISCFPKTNSGECEPLKPENFAPGGKFHSVKSLKT